MAKSKTDVVNEQDVVNEKKVRAYNLIVEINMIMAGVREMQNELTLLEAEIAKVTVERS